MAKKRKAPVAKPIHYDPPPSWPDDVFEHDRADDNGFAITEAIDKKVGEQAEVQVSRASPESFKVREIKYEIPDWFVDRYRGDIQDVVTKALASDREERTDFRVELAGSGTVGHLTVCTDGWRVWSPHPELIESWLGHLKPKG